MSGSVLKSIWYVVGNDDVFSCARASVRDSYGVCYRVAWANFFRSAFRADKNRLCTEKRAETHRRCGCAEASTKLAFAFALKPYFGVDALAFVHRTDDPGQFFPFNFRFRCRLYEGDAIGKMCGNHNITDGVTSFNYKLERILIPKHAK